MVAIAILTGNCLWLILGLYMGVPTASLPCVFCWTLGLVLGQRLEAREWISWLNERAK